ncbi:MAG: right-handed parallel beta-helix repeat-containing protein [Methanobrevibacter ruminantium]|uniref:right-handed parallel beta-helix repeat-containing protein n=2 Tax=Methanobrevibacter ruminantium TaxID=83816 RepID=UPI0026EB6C1B|nr:right-handed parallel beta-helix repeat-containing protein [Methanobrevibacter ruminantium]MDD6048681.1 right-handed parallel beta-helix repeat-containing protein [Methanobrevibacter ruminantium]
MRSKRIIGFSLIFIMAFLLIGLNTASASNIDSDQNLSDSFESSPVSNAIDIDNLGASEGSESNSLSDAIDDDIISNADNSNEETSNENPQSESKLGDGEKRIHTITEANYSSYFDSDGNLINSLVKANDTINLSGNFSNKKFIINIPLTITSTENDAKLKNSPIYYYNVSNENFAYDAIVSNLKIESDLPDISAVWVIGSKNIKILNNDIFTTGHNGYPISLDGFTYNCIVENNIIKTVVPVNTAIDSSEVNYDEENSGDNSSWQHSGISLRDAHGNSIVNNDITVENSYGVYLCYGTSTSSNNIIANNTIRATSETPSFWSYGVYITGNYNHIENNTIIRMYRGIHSSYAHNYIIGNKIYDINGLDENNGIGGDYGIYGGNDTLIANNSIYNADVIGAGILVGSNSDVYGNCIQINSSGDGIRIGDVEGGHNSRVHNNTIDFLSGAGISIKGTPQNTEAYDNIVNSLSNIGANQGSGLGIGILSIYQSRSSRPYNISIYNNTIYTSNEYAINIAQSSTESWLCENNHIGDRLIIYPIAIDYSPEWGDGTVYQVTEENYNTYFDSNGKLTDIVYDGDVLVFSGSFSPKGKIVLNKIVSLIGDNAFLRDTTIFVNTSNCKVQDFNIINNGTDDSNCNLWGIYVYEADNEVITGNNITIWDKNTSYGIYLCDSYNNTVANNSIKCQGDNLVFALLTYETYDTLFENNTILAIGTSELYPYYETICIDGVRSISELSKTYGVILDFSSDNQFIHNDIEVTSTVEGFQVPYNPSVNILIGLYIYYESNRNNISENNVYIHGHDPFLYGMGSSGDDTSKSVTYACENIFAKNNITIDADYFAMGMILRHNSKDTVVEDNQFNLYSNNYTYGLTLEISQGAKVKDNTLNLTGRAGIYAVELYSAWSNDISYNQIYANGSFSEVGLYGSSGNNITHNTIHSFGDGINDPAQGPEHPDSVTLINTGILLEKGSNGNIISDNTIITDGDNAITIDGSVGNTIANNELSSSKGGGNAAVKDNTGMNHISGNTGSRYGSNSDDSSNGNSGSPIHTNGTSSQSSNSGNSDSNGASSFGNVNSNFNANAQSSANDGAGDSGEAGDGSDIIASELEEVASKSLSGGVFVPVVALLLILVFCFSFLGAKDEDDEEE